jgi:sn-glycerol 3-phosphate transport system substrate-binding protein
MTRFLKSSILGGAALALSMSSALAVDLEFYFPVAVGGEAAGHHPGADRRLCGGEP